MRCSSLKKGLKKKNKQGQKKFNKKKNKKKLFYKLVISPTARSRTITLLRLRPNQ